MGEGEDRGQDKGGEIAISQRVKVEWRHQETEMNFYRTDKSRQ